MQYCYGVIQLLSTLTMGLSMGPRFKYRSYAVAVATCTAIQKVSNLW